MKLCVDLGATNVKSSLVDKGVIVKTALTPTDTKHGLAGVVASLKGAIDVLLDRTVTAICISSAGTIDVESGQVVYATDHLPDYTGFNLKEFVQKTYALPCVAVNDGHAALLGEILLNEEYGKKRVAMLTLGSGIGGAYAVNGELKADESNNYARFGHLSIEKDGVPCRCGNRGCLEQYLSGRAINRQAAEVGIDKDRVFQEWKKGDEKALAVVSRLQGYLKAALDEIAKVNPFDVCVLGGGVVDGMGDAFEKFAVADGYDIRRAKAGNGAGMLGAYYLGRKL